MLGIVHNQSLKTKLLRHVGTEFVVPFSSRSRSLALKSSLKSHQMTTLFVQNDKFFTQMGGFQLVDLIITELNNHMTC